MVELFFSTLEHELFTWLYAMYYNIIVLCTMYNGRGEIVKNKICFTGKIK